MNRFTKFALGLGTLAAAIFIAASGGAHSVQATPPPVLKVTICHATASATNPYVIETVDQASILGDGHGHSGVNIGDIIPPFPGYAGHNWFAPFTTIYNNGCKIGGTPSPTRTPSPSATFTPTLTVIPTSTPTSAATSTPTASPTPTVISSPSPQPTFTSTPTTTPEVGSTPTSSPTPTLTVVPPTPTVALSATATSTATSTPTFSPTPEVRFVPILSPPQVIPFGFPVFIPGPPVFVPGPAIVLTRVVQGPVVPFFLPGPVQTSIIFPPNTGDGGLR